jgi:putative ABC transport system substrate-binding protein
MHTRRRQLLIATGVALAARFAGAQPKQRVVGHLSFAAGRDASNPVINQGLRELGWIEGQNLRTEFRWAANDSARLDAMAQELVRLKVDVIVARATPAVQAAKKATSTIPIVIQSADPVGSGFVASLARPGGNITGLSMMMPALAGKRLELLRELLPKLSRVAFLAHGGDPAHTSFIRGTEEAGRRLGVRVQPLVVHRPEEYERAFSAMVSERADALIVQPLFVNTLGQGPRLAELAVANRLPTISDGAPFADQGGLLFYGADPAQAWKRVAVFIDKILKGAKPAELPVEQPRKFNLIVNLKTAKRLGVAMPQILLLRADRVIE